MRQPLPHPTPLVNLVSPHHPLVVRSVAAVAPEGSWYYCFNGITEDALMSNLRALKELRLDYPIA